LKVDIGRIYLMGSLENSQTAENDAKKSACEGHQKKVPKLYTQVEPCLE